MKWIILTFFVLSTVIITFASPEVLANNKFLDEIVSHELVAILIVILTVTMASVANIHLSLGRIRIRLLEKGLDIKNDISLARSELSENAWYIFYAFCMLLVSLFIKSHFSNVYVNSLVNSFGVVVFIFNMLVMYDIYKSVYLLSSLDDLLYTSPSAKDNEIKAHDET